MSKAFLDDKNIPFTLGAQDRDNLVLCRKHSCLVTHSQIAGEQMTYQAERAAQVAAAALVQDVSEKELLEDAKLLKKADEKKIRDDVAAKKKELELIRRAARSPEQVADEKRLAKDKAATAKLAKELKGKEDVEKIEAARARKEALHIVNLIVS